MKQNEIETSQEEAEKAFKVQVLNIDNIIIWEQNIKIETDHDPHFHHGYKPHMKEIQNIINALSIAKNQAVQDASHYLCMYVHTFGTYNNEI